MKGSREDESCAECMNYWNGKHPRMGSCNWFLFWELRSDSRNLMFPNQFRRSTPPQVPIDLKWLVKVICSYEQPEGQGVTSTFDFVNKMKKWSPAVGGLFPRTMIDFTHRLNVFWLTECELSLTIREVLWAVNRMFSLLAYMKTG